MRTTPPCAGSKELQGWSGQAWDGRTGDNRRKDFFCRGKISLVVDKKINAVKASAAGGPAYFYLFTELMARAGM
jgi:hypothetical protein